ncbi:MAG: phospholipid carrier-dependent glycosyltransferase [Candidatus Dormibacteria bacterium]
MGARSRLLLAASAWLRARSHRPSPRPRGDGGEPLVRAGLRGFLALERRDVAAIVALVLFSALLRFASPIFPDVLTNPFGGAPLVTWGIGHPYNATECTPVPVTPSSPSLTSVCGFVFDEVYFPVDAAKDLHSPAISYFDPEPPLAKLLMTPPIAAMGFETWSWRISTGVFGSLLVGVIYLIGLRLRRDRWFATMAALFIALDGLALVEARTGVIDIIAIFFVALFYYAFLLHWQARTPRQWRATLYAMAAVAGLAFAAKLTALAPLAVAAALILGRALAPHISALVPAVRRLSGPRRHEVVMWRAAAGRWAIVHYTLAAVVMVCVFSASFSRYLTIDHTDVYRFTACNPSVPGLTGTADTLQVSANPITALRNIADDMAAGLQYHAHECHSHPYASRWYTWPIMEHPVLFYYDQQAALDPSNPTVSSITDMGNPALWWLAIPALLACVWRLSRGPPLLRLGLSAIGLVSLAVTITAFHAAQKPDNVTVIVAKTPILLAGFAGVAVFAALVTLSAVISRRFVPAFIVLGYIASWMMWVIGNADRVLFFYHALGMLIFAALALAYVLSDFRQTVVRVGDRQVSLAPLAWTGVIAVVAAFVFFYPVWTAMPLPDVDHQMRLWVDAW